MSKIIILSTGDENGAYEAAYRIAKFTKEEGHEVALVVKRKTKGDNFIYEIPRNYFRHTFSEKVKNKFKRIFGKYIYGIDLRTPATHPKYLFLQENEISNFLLTDILIKNFPFTPELLIVGMTDGFITTNNLAEIHEKFKVKIALVTADMYPLTGGCHYAWDCDGYEKSCESCPALINPKDSWWPQANLEIKRKNIEKAGIEIISMSGWANLQIAKSTLFKKKNKILQINSCIDVELFNRNCRAFAKKIFGIPESSKVIFIGSQSLKDERKGVQYIVDALQILHSEIVEEVRNNVQVLLIGRDIESVSKIKSLIGFDSQFIEYIKDYRLLSLLYQASDLFVCGSIEDTGPMMVSEALACGSPVVGFDTGIVYNMVENKKNGIKVPIKDYKAMARAMKYILELDEAEFDRMSKYAYEKVKAESSKTAVINVINKLLEVKHD